MTGGSIVSAFSRWGPILIIRFHQVLTYYYVTPKWFEDIYWSSVICENLLSVASRGDFILNFMVQTGRISVHVLQDFQTGAPS